LYFQGWSASLSGTTLPDIQLIIGENLGRTSWIFTAASFGWVTSTIYLYKTVDKTQMAKQIHFLPIYIETNTHVYTVVNIFAVHKCKGQNVVTIRNMKYRYIYLFIRLYL